jgi:hypothetical protein
MDGVPEVFSTPFHRRSQNQVNYSNKQAPVPLVSRVTGAPQRKLASMRHITAATCTACSALGGGFLWLGFWWEHVQVDQPPHQERQQHPGNGEAPAEEAPNNTTKPSVATRLYTGQCALPVVFPSCQQALTNQPSL